MRLALSALAGAATPQSMCSTLSSPGIPAITATPSATGVPSWLPAGTSIAKKPGGKDSSFANCATVCYQNARACAAGAGYSDS